MAIYIQLRSESCTVVVKQGQVELLFRQTAISCQSSWGRCQTTMIRLLARKGTDCPLCVVLYCVHYNTHRTDSSNSQQHKEKNSCYDDHIKLKLSLEG